MSRPTHTAGSVEKATRPRSARRMRRVSSTAFTTAAMRAARACSRRESSVGALRSGALFEFFQHLVGRDVKRILLQDPADDHHGVRTHDVDYDTRVESREVIGADDGVVI